MFPIKPKALFSSPEIASEIHGYTTATNHKLGQIRLDYTDNKQKKSLLKEVKKLLKENNFTLVRASDEKLLGRKK